MISVIICTYNRCESLRLTLESLLCQELDNSFEYEVIVSDNNSSDKTKEVVTSFMQKFNGRLRYAFEPTQGKSYALNSSILLAKGEILAFTDDDVTVAGDWLKNTSLIFNNSNTDCLGGKILPLWQVKKPDWLTEDFFTKLALLDYGDIPFDIEKPDDKELYGANLAMRKNILLTYGGFRTDLGVKGYKKFGGEETFYLNNLINHGVRVAYKPTIIAYHRIPDARLQKKYFLKLYFDMGVSSVHFNNENAFKKIFGIPHFRIKKYFNKILAYLGCLASGDLKNEFYKRCKIIGDLGYFLEKIRTQIKLNRTTQKNGE